MNSPAAAPAAPAAPVAKGPRSIVDAALPPKPQPKKKAAKKASKKKRTAKRASKPSNAKPKEVDVKKLDRQRAITRLDRIYDLERRVERKRAEFDSASRERRAAKAEFEQALEDLEKEIQEQRLGPGPLFNADASGPAGAPQRDAAGDDDEDLDGDGDEA